jgi:TolB-like protein
MDAAALDPDRRVEPESDLLESWKRIATYLRRDIRTLQRWERQRNLPIHRLPGGGKASVYALRTELDAWRRGESAQPYINSGSPYFVSIAVLPFANLSEARSNQYFSQGLVDNLITGLTHLPGVQIAALHETGGRLLATLLLGGSVQVSGQQVRVTAQLVEAASGYHVWSEQFDRPLDGNFTAQDEIAKSIVEELACVTARRVAVRRQSAGAPTR